MIRLIVRAKDAGAAAHVGGPVDIDYRTFDVEAPALEAFLRGADPTAYTHRHVVGVEVLPIPTPTQEPGHERN